MFIHAELPTLAKMLSPANRLHIFCKYDYHT